LRKPNPRNTKLCDKGVIPFIVLWRNLSEKQNLPFCGFELRGFGFARYWAARFGDCAVLVLRSISLHGFDLAQFWFERF
jgi:hypothetical protein